MFILPKAKTEEHKKLLRKKVTIIRRLFDKLKTLYPSIKLSDTLTIRLLRKRNSNHSLTLAVSGYKRKQWYIAIRETVIQWKDRKAFKNLMAHEVAHIGEALMHKKWSHSKIWKEIYDQLNDEKGEIALGELAISIILWGWVIFGIIKILGRLI